MELLRFATAGSVDDGKSTLIGRLLFDSKSIFTDQLEAVERTSAQRGDETADLSLLTDGLRAEREQGITIDVAYRYFSTPARKFIIADSPGHVQYTRNMVTGASTADLAIILVDARKGVLEQTRRHAFLSSLLGIPHLTVCVNKMDLVDYAQERYDEIVDLLGRTNGSQTPAAVAAPSAAAVGPTSGVTHDATAGAPQGGVLDRDGIELSGRARTRDEAIEEAGRLLVAQGAVDDAYVASMHERERSVSTYMGNLLAIPHGTNEAKASIRRTALSFVRYADPVDWNGSEVKFAVGIAGAGDDHLTLLASLAQVFLDEQQVARLEAATSPEEVQEILSTVQAQA